MRYRRFGRLGWRIGEVGYGMWGIAGGPGGWTGADEARGMECLHLAADLGCNFFDTAWIYGRGTSERMLGRLVRERPGERLYVATKIPPANRVWPSKRGDRFADIFPADHLERHLHLSLENLGTGAVDLMQFHVWEDDWAETDEWRETVSRWRSQGLVRGIGLSINRWESWNCLKTLRTGLIDSVQVIYNIFDQNPEDELFPLCRSLDVGVIARVPFDEGSLTGTLTRDSRWPEGDWRNTYFVPENLEESVARADRLKPLVPPGSSLPDMALRFILANPSVSVTIPGMRSHAHVRSNLGAGDAPPLAEGLMAELRSHRWDRVPTWWSQ